jgi:hypothetical protein
MNLKFPAPELSEPCFLITLLEVVVPDLSYLKKMCCDIVSCRRSTIAISVSVSWSRTCTAFHGHPGYRSPAQVAAKTLFPSYFESQRIIATVEFFLKMVFSFAFGFHMMLFWISCRIMIEKKIIVKEKKKQSRFICLQSHCGDLRTLRELHLPHDVSLTRRDAICCMFAGLNGPWNLPVGAAHRQRQRQRQWCTWSLQRQPQAAAAQAQAGAFTCGPSRRDRVTHAAMLPNQQRSSPLKQLRLPQRRRAPCVASSYLRQSTPQVTQPRK